MRDFAKPLDFTMSPILLRASSSSLLYQRCCAVVIGQYATFTILSGRSFATVFFRRRRMKGCSFLCSCSCRARPSGPPDSMGSCTDALNAS